jgi:hypothetical protein
MTSKSTRFNRKQKYENIEQKLKKIPFKKYAEESNFKQRKPNKIKGKELMVAFFLMAMQGKNSFQHWAEQLGKLTGKNISKQGLWKRMTDRFNKFLLLILFDAMQQQTKDVQKQTKKHEWAKKFKRILLQDSTVLALPVWLAWCFPGNVSRGNKKAQLKIQLVYDILSDRLIAFEITAFTANDQSKSKDILSVATPEDLVIRDLGYFVLGSFNEMSDQGIGFISRLRYGVTIYDIRTGKEINLHKQIMKRGVFDKWVLVGRDQKTKARLVVQKLPEKQASERIRKAKNDRDKRLNHSKEFYEMLGYNIFITSEEQEEFSIAQIIQLYGLRWRIETIFKCWKSNFNLQRIIPQNCSLTKERVEAIIYIMLIFIILFQVTIYNAAQLAIEKTEKGIISLFKLSKFIANNIDLFLSKDLNLLMPKILYNCRYDKRSDRKNYIQKLILS